MPQDFVNVVSLNCLSPVLNFIGCYKLHVTRAVAPFSPDARTFHNIYKLQKHVLLRHQSYPIAFMGNKNLRFWHIMPL
jgi:hypothetical protein